MAAYEIKDIGRNPDRSIICRLIRDGNVVETGSFPKVYGTLRSRMKAGDTYKEAGTPVQSYGDMVASWKKDDAFDRGEY